MFSRCPNCDLQQQVTTQQLRDNRGLLVCVVCGKSFDALPTLTELVDDEVNATPAEELAGFRPHKPESPVVWRIGNVLLLLVLLSQVGYFQADFFTRQPWLYSGLARLCQTFGCRLPAYQNPADWSVSHSDLQPQPNNRYLLIAALTNQADIAHAFPVLKLAVTDYNGRPLAERLFRPESYSQDGVSAANHTSQIRLPLIISAPEVGGFTLSTL